MKPQIIFQYVLFLLSFFRKIRVSFDRFRDFVIVLSFCGFLYPANAQEYPRIVNGDFEYAGDAVGDESTYGWRYSSGQGYDADFVLAYDPDTFSRVLQVNVNNVGTSDRPYAIRAVQRDVALEPNTTYVFSADIKGAAGSQVNIEIAVNNARSIFGPIMKRHIIGGLNEQWQPVEFDFKTDHTGKARIVINLGYEANVSKTILFDNIGIKVKGNLIQNGGFELEDGRGMPVLWEVSLNSDEATVSLAPDPDHAENQVVAVDLGDDFASSNAGDIEISQSNVPIEAGKTYRYSLRMRTEVPGPGSINTSFDSTLNDEEYVAKLDDNLSPYWETYTMEFIASTDNDGRASIKLAFPENAGQMIFIDDVVLLEVNNNLIQNSDFEELNSSGQSAHWGLHAINADASFSVVDDPREPDNAVLAVNIHSASIDNLIWDIQIFQTDLAIEVGKSYRYSLRIRTDARGPATIDAAFGSSSRDYSVYTGSFDNLVSSDWKTYSMDFAAVTNNDGHLSIRMAFPENVGKTLYIDDVVVSEINRSLIQNSGFNQINSSNQPAVWGLHDWQDDASFSVVKDPDDPQNNVLAVNIDEITPGYIWDIQLFQTDLPLEAGRTYEYRFRVKSNNPSASVFAGVQSVADWASDNFASVLFTGELFNYLGDGWSEISLPFTPREDNQGHAVIQFAFAGTSDHSIIYIDDVTLRPVTLDALADL